jgi:hypothetical protein
MLNLRKNIIAIEREEKINESHENSSGKKFESTGLEQKYNQSHGNLDYA